MTIRVATYERVSSDDQRERATILTQYEELKRRLSVEPERAVVERYIDDGVSGVLELKDRPAGSTLLQDARAGRFDELWVCKLDRLGRDDIDPLVVRRDLLACAVRVVSLSENLEDDLSFAVHVAIAAQERRTFLRRSADGMSRAAREGRYTGGICPLGYRVAGKRPHVYMEPSDELMWSTLSEADVVRKLYYLVGVEGWSTRRVADEFNKLGIPTAYQKDGRAVRLQATQCIWRAGRIRNLLVNTVYKGELQYGRRSKKKREIISASVPALVLPELWEAAQETLARNRVIPTTSLRSYLLRGVIRCGLCGLTFCGTKGRDSAWYRCNGVIVERGPVKGKCWARAVKCDPLDQLVWTDIEAWLNDPGEVLDELRDEYEHPGERKDRPNAETLGVRLSELALKRSNAVRLAIEGVLSDADVRPELERIDRERAEIEARLAALEAQQRESPPQPNLSLLEAVRTRVPSLTFEEKQQIVKSLVKAVTVHTSRDERGRNELRVVIEYQFPAPDGVALTCNGTRGSQNSTTTRRVVEFT